MTYMNYKKDKALDTYIFKGERKKKEKIIRFDKKEIHLINSFFKY